MDKTELQEILRLHRAWLNDEEGGKRANLHGADLGYANLHGADLGSADLHGARCGFDAFFGGVKGAPFFQAVCGFGSRNAALTLLAAGERKEWRWWTGCFSGTEEELRAAVAAKHGDTTAGRCYVRAIDYLVAQAEDNAATANDGKEAGE